MEHAVVHTYLIYISQKIKQHVQKNMIYSVNDYFNYTNLSFVSCLRLINTICSRHDIAEILLQLALNTNQSINHLYLVSTNKFDWWHVNKYDVSKKKLKQYLSVKLFYNNSLKAICNLFILSEMFYIRFRFKIYSETCLNRTLNKLKSCLNRTFDKVLV